MAALTATNVIEISKQDIAPTQATTGTAQRRANIYIRAFTKISTEAVILTSYFAEVADVEGQLYYTYNSIVSKTASTWSNAAVTLAAHPIASIGTLVLNEAGYNVRLT